MKRPTFQQSVFAWMLRKSDTVNHRIYDSCKKDLFRGIQGLVVEIGPGTGVNMEYLDAGTEWIGIEPNPLLHKLIMDKADRRGIKATLIPADPDKILLDTNTVDVFICTLVLCSVDAPSKILMEIRRVLKPGGRLILIEHVASSASKSLLWAQHVFNPINRLVADGCNCNRRTWLDLEKAAFSHVEIRHIDMRGSLILHKPHIVGFAVK